jgi:hypothetical protein
LGCFVLSLENLQSQGAICKTFFVFIVEFRELLRGAPRCPHRHLLLPLSDEEDPWRPLATPRLPLLPFFYSLAALLLPHHQPLSLFLVKPYSSPWPPTSAGVLCFPQPCRRAEKVRLDVLLPLAKGIDPRCLESPPPSRIPRRKRAPPPPKFVVSGHPPAKPTPPAGSR